MEVTGGLLAEGYGLTEASPVTHCTPSTHHANGEGWLHRIAPARYRSQNRRFGDRRKNAAPGRDRRAGGSGSTGDEGYWQKPDETAQVLRDGWLLTGDIAHIDSDGYYYITDRKKDLIKTRGYSVYPRELEDILYEHPTVKLCAVIGKPDLRAGEVPKAYIVLKEGTAARRRKSWVSSTTKWHPTRKFVRWNSEKSCRSVRLVKF